MRAAAERAHPFLAAVRLRARDLARRPVVLAAFAVQGLALLVADLVAAATGRGFAGAGRDLVLAGLRAAAVPGGLVFAVLVAAVVGAEFGWATERALLARDPRRLRFAALQLAVAGVLALTWWAGMSLLAVGLGFLLGPGGADLAGGGRRWAAVVAALAATVAYGLLGAAAALLLRGALAAVVALLAWSVLGELVLAPQWGPASGWTLWAAAARLSGQGGMPLWRAGTVAFGEAGLALAASLALYAGREVRD
ncbi:MAG TPA: hypothetical protein VFD04_06435 [Actinomycetes bacterium]|nr:hypothetical protein [Actinomycetes bacterium]